MIRTLYELSRYLGSSFYQYYYAETNATEKNIQAEPPTEKTPLIKKT